MKQRLILLFLGFALFLICSSGITQEISYPYGCYLPFLANTPTVWRGVAKTHIYGNCDDVTIVNAIWYYDWSTSPPVCVGVEAVPMISCWQAAEALISSPRPLGGNSQWIMLFNEPDAICPMSPRRGAELTHALLPYLVEHKIVAPAPTDTGMNWLVEYRQQYISLYDTPPPMDALAMHCYRNSSARCTALAERTIKWAEDWGVPEVWVTEFSFASFGVDEEDALGEARKFIDWMVQHPKITRYAWFTNRSIEGGCVVSFLLDYETGDLTVWGRLYRE